METLPPCSHACEEPLSLEAPPLRRPHRTPGDPRAYREPRGEAISAPCRGAPRLRRRAPNDGEVGRPSPDPIHHFGPDPEERHGLPGRSERWGKSGGRLQTRSTTSDPIQRSATACRGAPNDGGSQEAVSRPDPPLRTRSRGAPRLAGALRT